VPVAREARLELERYLATRNDILPSLFVGQRGQMTPDGIRDVVVRYAGVSPHRLRHTFAYDFLEENNNDLVALADILGHDDIKTTRGYARRRPEDLQIAVDRVRYASTKPK
jgi:site-specific recombinase XerD